EGSVVVSGPLLSSGRALVAGERVRISVRESVLALHTARSEASLTASAPFPDDPPPSPPSSVALEPSAPGALAGSAASASRASGTSRALPDSGDDRAPSWRDLASAGKYKEAFNATERVGFAQEIERVSS